MAVYEAFVSAELTEGGIMSFQELKALTSGQYQIKGIALGDYREDGKTDRSPWNPERTACQFCGTAGRSYEL